MPALHLQSSKESMKITGVTAFAVVDISEAGEHEVDLTLLGKVALMMSSIRMLDTAKMLGYFCRKVYVLQCFIREGKGTGRQKDGATISGDPEPQVSYFHFSPLLDHDVLQGSTFICAPQRQAR